MQGPIKAVIFDMDGVLVNSEPLWRKAMVKAFNAAGIPFTEEDCRKTTGRRINEVVDFWLHTHQTGHINGRQLEAAIMEDLYALIDLEGEPMPGILAILDLCTQKGLITGLATSSSQTLMQRVLKKLNLLDGFRAALSAELLPYGKPHPEVFLLCAQQLQVAPAQCLVIEDSINGVIAAKAAHMRVIAVPDPEHFHLPGFAIADYKCANFKMVPKILMDLL